MSKRECIESMSPHLFWDVDIKTLDLEKHKTYIVQHVLEYGLMTDWELLKSTIGLQEVVNTCKKLRSLDPKALAFVSLISKTPIEEFRCWKRN